MTDASAIREHMEVIGADGAHLGTVDKIDGERIKLTKADSGVEIEGQQGRHTGHHHYISLGLVAGVEGDQVRLSATGVEGDQVRLSATGANAVMFEEEEDG